MVDYAQYLDGSYVFFDTETTGLLEDDEVVEFGLIDADGAVLYSSLFEPEKEVNPFAAKKTGLTNKVLSGEKKWLDEWQNIVDAIDGKKLIAYNIDFDRRLVLQTCERYGIDCAKAEALFADCADAMLMYAKYINGLPDDFKIKMEVACSTEGIDTVQDHRSTGDCLMMRDLLRKMADPTHSSGLEKLRENLPDSRLKALDKQLSQFSARAGQPLFAARQNIPVQSRYEELYDKGLSIEEIAVEQGVKPATVESHIVDMFSKGKNINIDFLISKDYEDEILHAHRNNPNGTLKDLKSSLPDAVSYSSIKAVIAKDTKGLYGGDAQSQRTIRDDGYNEFLDSQDKVDILKQVGLYSPSSTTEKHRDLVYKGVDVTKAVPVDVIAFGKFYDSGAMCSLLVSDGNNTFPILSSHLCEMQTKNFSPHYDIRDVVEERAVQVSRQVNDLDEALIIDSVDFGDLENR